MIHYILFALLNGLCISLSRVVIGRMSAEAGPFRASFWSYLVGFAFVTMMLIMMKDLSLPFSSKIPFFAYLGGVFGAIYVVINSYAFTRLGAVKTVLLVVSGQLISGVLIDYKRGSALTLSAQFVGVLIILIGIYLSKTTSTRREKKELISDVE